MEEDKKKKDNDRTLEYVKTGAKIGRDVVVVTASGLAIKKAVTPEARDLIMKVPIRVKVSTDSKGIGKLFNKLIHF